MTDFDRIAAFALGPISPPAQVRDFAATLLIDTLGVAAGAGGMAPAKIARSHALRFHSASSAADQSRLLFDGRTAGLPGAAFAAATAIDNLDAHDGYNPTKGHIGCAIVPALCAFAEAYPDLSGPEALDALIMAYEVSARAAIALHASVSDYHTSGAWNALGVAALGCRLRGHSADTLREALGIAEYHGPRSQMMREIATPTMLHDGSGMGALVGAMACLMAEDGFTGAPAITVEQAADYWADLGQVWTVTQNYVKPYPICRWAHASIDALAQICSAENIDADDVNHVEVRTFAQAAALFPGMPETTSQAQYSLKFALATHLVQGRLGPSEVTGDALSNPAVAAFLPRIDVHEVARHSDRFPDARWSDVTVRLRNGREFDSGDVHASGGPEAPMALADVEAKFHVMAAALPIERREAIWEMRHGLQRPDARFADLLTIIHPAVGGADGV